MKKFLALVLCAVMVLSASFTALAAETELDLTSENRGRGQSEYLVKENADGSITSATSNVSFYLPVPVKEGESITVTIKGSSDGLFRVWLINLEEKTKSNIFLPVDQGFTSGAFEYTFDLACVEGGGPGTESTELFFKAPSWDAKIDNLTIESITVSDPFATPVVEEAPAEEAPAATLPKTGVVSAAVIFGLGATAFGAGATLLKKKED